MTMSRLERFRVAQASEFSGLRDALRELERGQKRGHWIWYIFPQLNGLGRSAMAAEYAFDDVAEARDYLRDAHLRAGLRALTSAVAQQLCRADAPSLRALMGSDIDAMKLVSSMTLFESVGAELTTSDGCTECGEIAALAREILTAAARDGYAPCEFTRQKLKMG